jgi:hypothetical protein
MAMMMMIGGHQASSNKRQVTVTSSIYDCDCIATDIEQTNTKLVSGGIFVVFGAPILDTAKQAKSLA